MRTGTCRVSAKIYQFPARSRTAAADHRESSDTVAELISPRICDAAFGDCWYHEAALGYLPPSE
jgi:hypothetical protein